MLGSNQRRLSRRFYRPILPCCHTVLTCGKRPLMMPPAATLSAICTCAKPSAPPILRTATYRLVQHPKTAGRSAFGHRAPFHGNDHASTTQPDSPARPACSGAQTTYQASYTCRIPLTHPPCTSRRPASHGQRHEPPGTRFPRRKLTRLRAASQTTHMQKSRVCTPRRPDLPKGVYYIRTYLYTGRHSHQ